MLDCKNLRFLIYLIKIMWLWYGHMIQGKHFHIWPLNFQNMYEHLQFYPFFLLYVPNNNKNVLCRYRFYLKVSIYNLKHLNNKEERLRKNFKWNICFLIYDILLHFQLFQVNMGFLSLLILILRILKLNLLFLKFVMNSW